MWWGLDNEWGESSNHNVVMLSCLHLFPWPPRSPEGDREKGPDKCCTHGGFISQLRNSAVFRKSQSLKVVDSKPIQPLPWRQILSLILDSKYTCFLPWKETQFQFFKTVVRQTFLETWLRKSCHKTTKIHEELSLKRSLSLFL